MVKWAVPVDVLRGSSRVPAPLSDQPLRTFAWEASVTADKLILLIIPITRPYSPWNLKNYLEMAQSQLRVKQKCHSCIISKLNSEKC